jgi:hypothetical protein
MSKVHIEVTNKELRLLAEYHFDNKQFNSAFYYYKLAYDNGDWKCNIRLFISKGLSQQDLNKAYEIYLNGKCYIELYELGYHYEFELDKKDINKYIKCYDLAFTLGYTRSAYRFKDKTSNAY